MRAAAVALLAVFVALVGAYSAHAASSGGPAPRAPASLCVISKPGLERYREADAAVVATVVGTRVVEPVVVGPGPQIWMEDEPRGPLVAFDFRVDRVYKSGSTGVAAGDVLHVTYRVASPTVGKRLALLGYPPSDGGGWLPSDAGGCSQGLSVEDVRSSALLERYGEGKGAESFGCASNGRACWSIKRDRHEAILRAATYELDLTYTLCVRAPDRSRKCREFPLASGTGGLQSSRVRWSRWFPNKGAGLYRVVWALPSGPLPYQYTRPGYHSPRLTFRR